MGAPPVIIDLRLCTWPEMEATPKLIEREHRKLHNERVSHIHIDGSLDKYPN